MGEIALTSASAEYSNLNRKFSLGRGHLVTTLFSED